MADTFRTKAELLAIFADNSTGDISEQDMRDLVTSIFGGFASLEVASNVTAQMVSATPAKVANWSDDGLNSDSSSDYTVGEITIGVAGVYNVSADLCFEGTNGKTFSYNIYIDSGAGFVDSGGHKLLSTITALSATTTAGMHGLIEFAAGDKIALYVWSDDGGTSITLKEGALSAKREF